MNTVILLGIICITIYYCITWMLPKIIGYFFIKRFNTQIKFGRVSLPFTLRAVKIIKNGFSIQIDEITIRSSFFNSEVSKLLSITIRDIRVNKDINETTASDANGGHVRDDDAIDPNLNVCDFRNKKLPPSIIKFAQFMSVNVQNISVVMMNNTFNPSWFLHATAGDLHLDGSTLHSLKTLVVTAALSDARLKFFRHYNSSMYETHKLKPCLAELSFGIALDGELTATGPLAVEKMHLVIKQTKTYIHDGLYDFIRDTNHLNRVEKKTSKSTQSLNIDELCQRISPVIPKNFTVKVDNAAFSAVKDDSTEDFTAKLDSFTLNGKFATNSEDSTFRLPFMYAAVQLEQFEIDTQQEKLLFIELFTINTTLEHKVLNTFFKIKSFQFVYNHEEIYDWVNNNIFTSSPSTQSKSLSLILPNHQTLEKRRFSFGGTPDRDFEWLMNQIIIKCCAEVFSLSILTKVNNRVSSLSVSHTKVLLDQFEGKRNTAYENKFLKMLLGNRHWSTELMIESFWWSLNNATRDDTLRKIHTRGSPIYVGVSLVKLSSYGNAIKLDLSLHTLRLEYSSGLTDLLIRLKECLGQYGFKTGQRRIFELPEMGECFEPSSKIMPKILINAKITDVTSFLFTNHDACILIRLTEVSLVRTQQITVFKLDELHLAVKNTIEPQTNALFNLNDFTELFTNMKLIRVEYLMKLRPKLPTLKQFNIQIVNDAVIMWNSNLHMQCFTLLQDVQQFLRDFIPEKFNAIPEHTSTNSCDDEKTSNGLSKTVFEIYAESNLEIGIKLSERHSMQIFFENLFLSTKEQTMLSIEKVFINIDDAHIFTITDASMHSATSLEFLRMERANYEHFVCPVNKVWVTTLGSFKIIYPYDHDFADAFQNEFNSLIKWLKGLHGIQRKPFTDDSPLPSDMVIQIKEFLLELSDDPFEVKLRDNYVLLVDEYHESIKRQQLFEQKIQQIVADRLLLPAETLAELHANLVKKNSEIYIQRSKKIKEAGPTRTRLFAWTLTDVEFMIMADPSLHGPANVLKMMKEIDAESPWPEDGLDFITLWCRAINFSCTEWKFLLRDFPQPMFYVKNMHLFGHLCGAEQTAPPRAKRDVEIVIGAPFGTHTIQRSLLPLKFYHDFDCDWDLCSYAFGPCWEPVMAQCNLSFEKIFPPSRDPSPTLPFWDKMRLLYHGRLTIIAKQFTVLLHASLDPYNTTEEMELTWNNCGIIWTNAKVIFKGELNICVRTASRYDDCRLLHFPNLKLTFKLNWVCLGNPNDHHVVIPCAPDKLPEYSSNQVHDSYRAFRSQNLNIWVSFETKPPQNQQNEIDLPHLVLYGSTLRWFESLKLILSGVTRPTRRGPVFNNVRPRKKQLSRHYKKAHLQMSLHKFQVVYWMSHALHRGFELNGGRVTFSSEHQLTLYPIDDGLTHRPRAEWATMYMNCELNDTEIWLKSILNDKVDVSTENISNLDGLKIVKFYFLSLAKVSYGREALLQSSNSEPKQKDSPIHKLVVYDLKGAWTKNNRDVAFALFDSFMKSQKLKYNLSTEALQGFRKDNTNTPMKSRSNQMNTTAPTSTPSTSTQQILSSSSGNTSQINQKTHASTMLQQLIAEADHKFNVYSDDLSTQTREQQLEGLRACQDEDVTQYNWFISLVNSQVLLKGCETSGYVIMSAAKAEILQRVHRPVWRDRSLVSKTTWVGFLDSMQYYATVSPGENDSLLDENIMWLTLDNIQEKDKEATVINDLPDIPHLVGSGQSVGGVVSETVGAPGNIGVGEPHPIQLQRIVSRCKCEFFYVSYGDTIDPGTLTEVPQPPPEETLSPWERQDDPVDAFTLMHHDLDVCTNSLQYAMILDIVNNLMLYVEPQRKQALEKLVRMRFQLQLYSSEDQKRPIQQLQTQIRNLMSKMRLLEKDIHLIGRARAEEGDSDELKHEYEEVQKQIQECKEKLNAQSEELDMMFSCYKETQLSAMNKLATVRKNKPITIVRTNEICFKHAQWRLTEADGQIGIADLILSNFLYKKVTKSDDSVEHLLELGYIRMNNLIPRETYKEVLCPTEIQKDMPVDHQKVLRIFCREKPPVGGISVKEHFEINVVPITLAITRKFYSTMLKFCFPDRDTSETETMDEMDDGTASISGSTTSIKSSATAQTSKKSMRSKKSNKDSAFYVKIEKDDVEKMKERAEKNKLFIYIKIPEVPVRVSYKGNKQKNFKDITDFSLVIPTLEYHNVTWTWLDLLLAMKSDSRRVIVSQAIKQKLQIHRNRSMTVDGERPSPQEEDKAKMLFGNRHAPENKSTRKGVFKFPTKQ